MSGDDDDTPVLPFEPHVATLQKWADVTVFDLTEITAKIAVVDVLRLPRLRHLYLPHLACRLFPSGGIELPHDAPLKQAFMEHAGEPPQGRGAGNRRVIVTPTGAPFFICETLVALDCYMTPAMKLPSTARLRSCGEDTTTQQLVLDRADYQREFASAHPSGVRALPCLLVVNPDTLACHLERIAPIETVVVVTESMAHFELLRYGQRS
jgi:hypothetical protein